MAELKSMVKGKVLSILYGVHVGQAVEDEETLRTNTDHWYAEYSQYLGKGILPPRLSHQERQGFLNELKFYSWEDPFLYKKCADGIVRRCAMEFQMQKYCNTVTSYRRIVKMGQYGQPPEFCSPAFSGQRFMTMLGNS